MALYEILLFSAIFISPRVTAQSYDTAGYGYRIDKDTFNDEIWSRPLSDIVATLGGSRNWYATEMTASLIAKYGSGKGLGGLTTWSSLSGTEWMLNLIPPVYDNFTTLQQLLKSWPPSQCRPDLLFTLIARLKTAELEQLANITNSQSPVITKNNGYPLRCLKMFSMVYMLSRTPTTLTQRDIDLMLPAGLYLAPTYLLRQMPARTLNYMIRLMCRSDGYVIYDPGAEVPTLQLRALLDQMVANALDTPILNGQDLCRCLPYLRRPVFETHASSFSGTTITSSYFCLQNESSRLDFSGEFRDPVQSPAQRNFAKTVTYPPDKCRYVRGIVIDWSLSKLYYKVNASFAPMISCLSTDKRQSFRKENISVAWDMLSEQMHRPLSVMDREDTCLYYRDGYNVGKLYLSEQSLQQIGDAIACIPNFEIRRIPNLYLCTVTNLQRFSDPTRPIAPEVAWEVARKCDYYFWRTEGVAGSPSAPLQPVALGFGYLVQYLPLLKFQEAADRNALEKVKGYLLDYVPLMPAPHRFVIADGLARQYNDSFYNLRIRMRCDYHSNAMMSTVTFLNNASLTCTDYEVMTLSQKIYAAKNIVASTPDLRTAIDYQNVTWSFVISYNLEHLLDAMPYDFYSSFASDEVLDAATAIVNAFPDISTPRLKILSESVILEFKRRAILKFKNEKLYPYEMREAILDSIPCQLLMHLRPYDISNIQRDVVACRTLSRRWASCPQFLLKTQAYRDYTCNVFMHCGNQEPDYNHLVDDLGMYCFCNLTENMIANMSKEALIPMFPVLSELPNCLSQLARIALTGQIIDIYPPKTYVTDLIPAGQEAWLTELGKLTCNLNAAIVSERYKKVTFSSQAEYLGRACCFDWMASGTPQQRRLIAGVYFNKTVDDLWDIRKMCERMFNTTAAIIVATIQDEANSNSNRRKKRDVDDVDDVIPNNRTRNCQENEDNDDEEEEKCTEIEEAEKEAITPAITLRRRKRDVVIAEDFSWSCPMLKAMTSDSLYLLSEKEFNNIKHLDFIRCLSFFGSSKCLSQNFSLAVVKRIRVELSRYFSFCDTSTRVLIQLGYIATALTPTNISCLNITDEVVVSFGQIERFSQEQLAAIALRYVNLTTNVNNETFTVNNMALMGHAICGLEDYYFSKYFLADSDFDYLVPLISKLKNCSYEKLNLFKNRAISYSLYGPVSDWQEEHFVELGIIAAGMDASEAATLTPVKMKWLSDNALLQPDFTKLLNREQLVYLLPEQARIILPNAESLYPLNETMSDDQIKAVIVAELDDMYIEPAGGLFAKAANFNSDKTQLLLSFILAVASVFFTRI